MVSHQVSPEYILPAAERVAAEVGSRRPGEAQSLIAAYTSRMVGVVARLGYGIEYQAAARLHRVGEDPRINRNYFYRHEGCIPFCVSDAALLMDEERYSPVHERLRAVVTSPIAVVVTYSEAALNYDGQVDGAPDGDTMNRAKVQLLSRVLEPLLPPRDAEV